MKKLISADKLMKALRDRQCTNALIDTVEHEISYMTDDLTIPDNPTNGDIIKAMFSDIKYEILNNTVLTNMDNGAWFSLDWWNAHYERNTDADSD